MHHLFHRGKERGAVSCRKCLDGSVQQVFVGVPQKSHCAFVFHAPAFRTADELVEHRERVTHGASAGAHDKREHPGSNRDILLRTQARQIGFEFVGRHEAERVMVSTRTNRTDDLLRLGGRKNELHVSRRFFDKLEEGVKTLVRHHMCFVDNKDFVAVTRWSEGCSFAQFAGVVNTTVRSSVKLHNVERPAAIARQLHAGLALATRGISRALRTVQAARQDTGRRRLPTPARAGEQVGMGRPVTAKSRHERFRHVTLPNYLLKRFRPVAPIQSLTHIGKSTASAQRNYFEIC